MKTQIISLYGGPGVGKSTLSAEIFVKLKRASRSTELVREYVKDWAWEGRKIDKFDQLHISGEQSKKESILYGKVEVIVTDSPILLGAFYEQHYQDRSIILPSVMEFTKYTDELGIVRHNFLLTRKKKYVTEGRYESEDQARMIDVDLARFLTANGVNYTTMDTPDDERADQILKQLGLI
jgi:nicotinamide riboside kinase